VTPDTIPILIAGGGIAGVTAALALAQAGRASIIFERAPRYGEVGAGLQISPNAAAVLANLGLGEDLDAAADQPATIQMFSGISGKRLAKLPIKDYCLEKFDQPYRVVHRADLLNLLLAKAAISPLIELRTSAAICDVSDHADGLAVNIEEGQFFSGSGLIAADGVWSATRSKALNLVSATATGRTAWRALVPVTAPLEPYRHHVGLWMGPKAHLVHYPVRNGSMINLVALIEDGFEQRTWDGEADAKDLYPSFQTWCPQARELLRAPAESGGDWMRWPLYQRKPERYATTLPIALVGDAWHATLPFMAQGAAMAIEDAACLAHNLGKTPDIRTAFGDFQTDRLSRTGRLVDLAARNGKLYHMRGPMAAARDLTLSALPANRLLSQLDWIYGWKPPALT